MQIRKNVGTSKELQKSYDEIYRGRWDPETKDIRILELRLKYFDWILDLLETKSGKTLLDIGCGAGYLLTQAEERGLLPYGIDISNVAIELAKKNAPNSKASVGNAEELPYPDMFFDYITALGSLEHLLDIDKGIRELTRVLKDEGRVCIELPNSYCFMDIYDLCKKGVLPSHGQESERFATWYEWKNLLEINGLKVIKTYKYNGFYAIRPLRLKSLLVPLRKVLQPFIPFHLSYDFIFICKKGK